MYQVLVLVWKIQFYFTIKHKFVNYLILYRFTIEYIEINLNYIDDHTEVSISKHLIILDKR